MPTLTINEKEITVDRGTSVLRAAAMLGFDIPHFCYHPALSVPANCRMCLVEIEKARKLEPACYAKVGDGMVVHTESEKVKTARRAVLEFILINHPVDCPICDQAGECKLQDYYVAYDAQPSRLETPKVPKAKVHPIGPHVVYDGERCILCTRCVRFCDEITGTSELTVVQRGDDSEIRTFPGRELDNAYSMNVTDICPVGALTTRDFRFKCRVWLLSSTDSICVGCARGCNVHLEHFQGEVQRYRPRFNPDVNEYWMCDTGRLSYRDVNQDRLVETRVDDERGIGWPRLARRLQQKLGDVRGEGVAFVASAQATVEALWTGKKYAEEILAADRVYWTGRPDGDADEFLIVSDKNPNRAGVEEVFGASVLENDSSALLRDLEAGRISVLFMTGNDLQLDEEALDRFMAALRNVELFIFLGAHGERIAGLAHAVLPAATHAEQDGSFINVDGLVQEVFEAFRPLGQSLPEWEIYSRLFRGADKQLDVASIEAIQSAVFDNDVALAAGE